MSLRSLLPSISRQDVRKPGGRRHDWAGHMLGDLAVGQIEGGPVIQTVVVMDRGLLIVRAVTASTVLTVLAAADCDLGQVAYEMALIGEQASHVLGQAVRGGPRWPG